MRFLEPVLVTLFESEGAILFVTGSLLLKTLLSHHVQLSGTRQLCVAPRLLSRFLAHPIRRPFLRSSAVRGAMGVERRHPAHDKCRDSHHHKKPHEFEFSGHDLELKIRRESVSMELMGSAT